MTVKLRFVAVGVTALACALLPAARDISQSSSAQAMEHSMASTPAGLEADIRRAAHDLGMSEAEVAAYTRGQEDFSAAADAVQEKYPNDFVHAEWRGPDSPRTMVYVHPDVLAQVRSQWPQIPVQPAATMGAQERADRSWRALNGLRAQGFDVVGVTVDPLTEATTVEVPATTLRSVNEQALAEALAAYGLSLTETHGYTRAPDATVGGEYGGRQPDSVHSWVHSQTERT